NGPGGHNTMSPWTVNGNALAGIPADGTSLTDAALKQARLGDVVDEMRANVSMAGPARGGGAGISFHNEFNLSVPTYGGGSNAGIDVRRTVNLLPAPLHGE